ncbi:MAG TPA: dehydrogenase E1 component subunit alpha/beta [Candidatus Marinimicrobia bacterium]|jgi:2-oxoisovalerate dehydrogenase E1 component|nr:dehydrogenase E1 component subunit alpha/beta [Candidatus Neomarinimicrobiota bacterium]MDP7565898.1 dehydrogenase E1 component subunit alpha/beta [Candidatus Neomarinimicrobiota bacterium]MEE1505859.1 dehydrogenase E1 component subunit alpha/beta [Candidatus Neomarinimicrobiota bacterium]MEE1573112.1 dehydrogenase E1 component subunit alpha/beta [Candidatus Neomarinimicrobiota bacterium]HJL79511.1 dehydrogenase E1 component subunit alpha/beta [Candidatus Neomarinimicrobiota bacterium]|tara:strand:- start:6907 stop:8916 length:2010 start_codon:yes stop_codon:yes gene_type:complete
MKKFHNFSKTDLTTIYKTMVTARKLDTKMLTLLKQGKSFFHIGCSGHEAAQLAASQNLKQGRDWAYPYYRDAAFCLGFGMTPREQLLSFLARKDDPNSGGRQLPQHYGHKDLQIVSQSSPTGTQLLQAVGCAMTRKWEKTKEIVYVSCGEGTTSQGDFHEALNWSSREKIPVLFHVEDNKYAISVHISEQTSGNSVYTMASGYQNLERFDVDGTDFFESYLAFESATDRARKGEGPSVVVSHVVRLLAHSSSDDQRKYRLEDDLKKDSEKDPIKRFIESCNENGIIRSKEFEEIDKEIQNQIDKDAAWALDQEHPDVGTAFDYVYSGQNIKTVEPEKKKASDKIVMVDAINHALNEEMNQNEKMVIYGQDVADPKGGVFTATKGLSDTYGKDRVFNAPLAESSIIGTAVGMAVTGWKPVVEIQFGDYIWTGMMQIRNEVATMRYRSNNKWTCPLVIRVPVGGYIHGSLCHSQSIDGFFVHLPGIYIAYPSTASDAKGLLKSACRMSDPVLFMEHKGLYRQGYCRTPEPDENFLIPFGKARIVQEGNKLTIITWGAMVQKAIEAAKEIDISTGAVEIIDLRTLNPLDTETIGTSLEKTGRALIVYEDNITNGPGAEIAAIISHDYFELLDGPIKRVAAKDVPIPFNWYLEEKVLPQKSDIVSAITELMEY